MVTINAFKGITYNSSNVNIDKSLFAPPYDVISPEYQDELYSRNKYNIVRLILGKKEEADNEQNNCYTRASRYYETWLSEGVMIQSDKPSIYYYIQKYKDSLGNDVERKGFIARCYLEDFSSGNILPHEETMGGPKQDRLNLMMATKANLSQIFSVYSDPELQVDSLIESALPEKPFVDVLDDDNVRHIFYIVDDLDVIKSVKVLMKDKVALIADGHHRYETALKYRDIMRDKYGNDESEVIPYNSLIMYFSNIDDKGLKVYPTHRLLKKAVNKPFSDVLTLLNDFFIIDKYDLKTTNDSFGLMEDNSTSGMYIGLLSKETPEVFYLLKPKYEKVKDLMVSKNVPEILLKLDVTILHRLILEHLLDLDTIELKNQNNIEFIRSESDLVEKFNKGDAELVFLMNIPDIAIVKEICMAGFRMPQKTTYFYPKLLSGLVINSLT